LIGAGEILTGHRGTVVKREPRVTMCVDESKDDERNQNTVDDVFLSAAPEIFLQRA